MTIESFDFVQIFSSWLETNTYHPAVDLTPETREDGSTVYRNYNVLEADNEEWEESAHEVSSLINDDPDMREVFSNPVSLDYETNERYRKPIESNNFKCLSHKTVTTNNKKSSHPWYNVISLDDQFIAKVGTDRVSDGRYIRGTSYSVNTHEVGHTQPKECLLRFKLAKLILQVSQEHNLNISVPREVGIEIPSDSDDEETKYVIISERKPILSRREFIQVISDASNEEQIALANRLCTLITETGYIDTNLGNITFNSEDDSPLSEREILLVDTESLGALEEADERTKFPTASIQKASRIAIDLLYHQVYHREGLMNSAFVRTLKEYYNEHKITWDETKVILMATIIVPIVLFIFACFKSIIEGIMKLHCDNLESIYNRSRTTENEVKYFDAISVLLHFTRGEHRLAHNLD